MLLSNLHATLESIFSFQPVISDPYHTDPIEIGGARLLLAGN